MKNFDYYCTLDNDFISQEDGNKIKKYLCDSDFGISDIEAKYLTDQLILLRDETAKRNLRDLESQFWKDLWEELEISDPNIQEELILEVTEYDRYVQEEIFYSEKNYEDMYKEIKNLYEKIKEK